MWKFLGEWVLKNRLVLLIGLIISTAIMGYFASKVTLSYEFAKAIPTDNPKYVAYQSFKQKFGDDGNLLVIGITTDKLFQLENFKAYNTLQQNLKQIKNVEDVLSIPTSLSLEKDILTEKLSAIRIFGDSISNQQELDDAKNKFLQLPFYKTLLYNPATNAYLMAARINKDTLNSAKRTQVIANINNALHQFEIQTKIVTHVSGLPLIRTIVADKIQQEMKYFLIGSILLSAIILLLFFRSVSTTLLSLAVVLCGVIWSVGLMYLFGYKISLLTALIPSLVVVIGVPNCIYFINKYHTNYLQNLLNKNEALIGMVSKMGVVTLFCNITAAIGFAVFALTKSAILKEFGVVAGFSIMIIFLISFILLPSVLSYLPTPSNNQTKYLNNKWITSTLNKIEYLVLNKKKLIYTITSIALIFSIIGIFKLKTEAFIVDDLPKTDKVYTDLKYFEQNFKGVMPLEIVIDAKKPNALRKPGVFAKIDSLDEYIMQQPTMNRPFSLAEAYKFFYQGFSGGDSSTYFFPNETVINQGLSEIKRQIKSDDSTAKKNTMAKMFLPFIDSTMQYTRISVSMADVGTKALPTILGGIETKTKQLFDSSEHKVELTGTSITFLEGSKFIINGLKESILWAFLLIALCMLYLFKSARVLLYSLVPNVIPLIITAGIMGWCGVPIKPSTVLIFSVALGIAIDITIRFLVNYKQELSSSKNSTQTTISTLKNTGLSIIYTALVLTAGFVIFCFSDFGGTKALGWLTSVTLIVATLTNLLLLPCFLVQKTTLK